MRNKKRRKELKQGKVFPIIKKFCIRGHDMTIIERDKCGACCECRKEDHHILYERDKEKIKIKWHNYYEKHKQEIALRGKIYREKSD